MKKNLKALLAFVLLFGIIATVPNATNSVSAATTDGTKTVKQLFPDLTLAIQVAEKIKLQNNLSTFTVDTKVTQADLDSVLILFVYTEANQAPIANLEGLQYLNNLINLDIKSDVAVKNTFTNLSPLSTLKKLERLAINKSNISDLSALSTITTLNTLQINSAKLTTIAPITTLTNLVNVQFNYNAIKDIGVLATLPKLNSAYLTNNNISDVSSLANTTLDTVDFSEQVVFGTAIPKASTYTITVPVTTLKGAVLFLASNQSNLNGNTITVSHDSEIDADNSVDIYFSDFLNAGSISRFLFNGNYIVPVVENNVAVPVITANFRVTYKLNTNVSAETFISDIAASTNDGSSITVDFSEVDFTKPGNYYASLNAKSSTGIAASTKFVNVKILADSTAGAILVEKYKISLPAYTGLTVEKIIELAQVTTTDGSPIIADFTQVDITTEGEYIVVLKSKNANGVEAFPVMLILEITPGTKPLVTPEISTPAVSKPTPVAAKVPAKLANTGETNNSVYFLYTMLAGSVCLLGLTFKKQR